MTLKCGSTNADFACTRGCGFCAAHCQCEKEEPVSKYIGFVDDLKGQK